MTQQPTKSVYEQVLEVTYDYLGPAAERFVARLTESHLGKKPEHLTKQDIAKLHDWSKLGFAMLADDKRDVDNYTRSLLQIADERQRRSHR